MSYIKEKLVPGYTGKFVISSHYAHAHHWDFRLEFPVSSVSKALADYSGKRPKKGVEPTPEAPDKPGTVLRSWAIPKHCLPGKKPLLATETENHAIQYWSFQGVIPSGYGAGTVKIIDKGTYTLNSVLYDKKYVFTLHGKKIKDSFALIKTSGKSFLWIKTKEKRMACISNLIRKTASAIDYVQPALSSQLFDLTKNPPEMKEKVRWL